MQKNHTNQKRTLKILFFMPTLRKEVKPKDNFFYHIPSMSGFPLLKLISLLHCGKHKQ